MRTDASKIDKEFWSALAALVGGVIMTLGWMALLIWLADRFEPLVAYSLSCIPLLVFLGVALAIHEGSRRRLRRRVIDEEWRR